MQDTYVENVWGVGKDMKGVLVGKNTKFQALIFAELMKQSGLFDKSGPGGKPDNKITTHDFMTPENYIAAASYLTSYNPTAVNAFANFLPQMALMYVAPSASLKILATSAAGHSLSESRRSNYMGETNYMMLQKILASWRNCALPRSGGSSS